MFYCYIIINTLDNKSYIGVTGKTVTERYSQHWKESRVRPNNRKLYNAFNKYGEESFIIKTLCCSPSQESIYQIEMELIEEYNSFTGGYNMTLGGEGNRGLKMGLSTIIKMRKNNLGSGNPFYNKKHTELTKSLMGRKLSELSEEDRKVISDAQKNRKIKSSIRSRYRASRNNPGCKAADIFGVKYHSVGFASQTLDIKKGALRYRLSNPKYPSYKYL